MGGAELYLNRLACQLRKGLGHFAIKNERKIGVELFLKLMQLGSVSVPGAGTAEGVGPISYNSSRIRFLTRLGCPMHN
jgi:hypothetical protein